MNRNNRKFIRSLSLSSSALLRGSSLSRSGTSLLLSSISSSGRTTSSKLFSSFTKQRVNNSSSSIFSSSIFNPSSSLLFRSVSTTAVVGFVATTFYYGASLLSRAVHSESNTLSRISSSKSMGLVPYDEQEYSFLKSATSDLEIKGPSEDPLQIKVGTSLYDNPIDTLIRRIGKSKYSIQAVVYKFDNDQIYASLSDALSRGVRVQLICDSKENKKPKSKAYKLRAEGASVEFWDYNRLKKLHAKFTIVDAEYVLSGSSNWTRNADNDNMELVLEFNGNVSEFVGTFDDMWALAGGRIGVY